MSVQRNPSPSTAEQILDLAEPRVQLLGFNGFSYADIAGELGVTTASIHYHFPAKSDLGVRLIERYTERFLGALRDIDAQTGSASDKVRTYVALYEGVLAEGRLCLCGMMAAEYATLGEPMRAALIHFFKNNEDWLEGLLARGRAAGELEFHDDSRAVAMALISAFEGATLIARAHGGVESFRTATRPLLASVCHAR